MGTSARETDGLVPHTSTPMLQPWEVYDRDLFDLEMVQGVRTFLGVAR